MENKTKEEILKEWEDFMLDEYGKWKIGRIEARQFLSQALSKVEKEAREEFKQIIKDSMWVCPSHTEVNPIKNKCADCSEAASVNVILKNLLNIYDQPNL